MCCNESTDYKMLAKFVPDIFALSYGKDVRKDVTPIYWGIGCAIFRPFSFGWKIKILGSIFNLQLTFGQILMEHILLSKYGKVYSC